MTTVATHGNTTAAGFTESLHPRHPSGNSQGGEFADGLERVEGRMDWGDGFIDHRAKNGRGVYFRADEPSIEGGGVLWKALLDRNGNELAFWFPDDHGLPHHLSMADELGLDSSYLRQEQMPAGLGMTDYGHPSRHVQIRHARDIHREEDLSAAAVDFTGDNMVCLYIDQTTAADIAVGDGQAPQDLHITLALLPEEVSEPQSVAARLFEVAQSFYPLAGEIGGLGMFGDRGHGVPVIALPNVLGMSDLRTVVVSVLEDEGVIVADNYGWLPHVTLGYGATTMDVNIVGTPLQFGELSLVVGMERWDLPFGGAVIAADTNEALYPTGRYPPSQGGHRRGWGLGPNYTMREDQMVGRRGGVAQIGNNFDPSKHPREPSGSEKGGEWAAKLGVTPFRPGDESVNFYKSAKFRAFDKSIAATALRYDVIIDSKHKVAGYWDAEQEPSMALDVHDGEEGVRLFAEDLRGQWDQDAVLIFNENQAGKSFSFRAKAKGDIASALSAAGIEGATIYRDGFEIFGDASDAARVIAVADLLGIRHSEVKVRAGSLSFAERPIH